MDDEYLHLKHLQLIGVRDAREWARVFVETVANKPAIAVDVGTMCAWFACAIETGYDIGRAADDD